MSILIHMLYKPEEKEWLDEAITALKVAGADVHLQQAVATEQLVPAARQEAFELAWRAGYKWIGFFDPDDLLLPGVYKKLLALAEENTVVVGAKWYDTRKPSRFQKEGPAGQIIKNNFLSFHNCWLLRASIWPKVSGVLTGCQSPAWHWKLLRECQKFGELKCLREFGMIYRYQQDRGAYANRR